MNRSTPINGATQPSTSGTDNAFAAFRWLATRATPSDFALHDRTEEIALHGRSDLP